MLVRAAESPVDLLPLDAAGNTVGQRLWVQELPETGVGDSLLNGKVWDEASVDGLNHDLAAIVEDFPENVGETDSREGG